MQNHPASDVFPMMSDREYRELRDDIQANGVLEPAWTHDGKILDGRNRAKACDELGIELPCRIYEGEDPFGFVISLNLHRRHLNESQRGMVANRISGLQKGRPAKNAPSEHLSQTEAAALLNVGRGVVQRAKQVEESGDRELIAKVDGGELSVNAAVTELKRRENTVRRAEIAKLESSSPDKLYNAIVIDPPWPMEKIEREVAPNQAGFDYPTMPESEMAALEIPADKDCHMWLWTTHKFMPMAFRLLDAWKFKYVCTFVWHKPGGFQPFGLPQYNSEFALYARRGSPTFVETKAFFTCFDAPRGEHSEKPEAFYEVLRRVTEAPRIDMFNRRSIDGFDVWGNEAKPAA